jgi:hypothetical protein
MYSLGHREMLAAIIGAIVGTIVGSIRTLALTWSILQSREAQGHLEFRLTSEAVRQPEATAQQEREDPIERVLHWDGKQHLRNCDLVEADLSEVELPNADLRRSNLEEADLTKANLQGAILSRANLQRAKLAGAELGRGYLIEADLREASLEGTDLQGAQLWKPGFREPICQQRASRGLSW